MIFLDVVARWPGSTHDSFILRHSEIHQRFEAGEFGDSVLLGDSGYPLKKWSLTPFADPTTPSEARYNVAHKLTRVKIERYG